MWRRCRSSPSAGLVRDLDVIAALPGLIVENDSRLVRPTVSLDPIGHSVGVTLPASRTLGPSASALIDMLVAEAIAVDQSRRTPSLTADA